MALSGVTDACKHRCLCNRCHNNALQHVTIITNILKPLQLTIKVTHCISVLWQRFLLLASPAASIALAAEGFSPGRTALIKQSTHTCKDSGRLRCSDGASKSKGGASKQWWEDDPTLGVPLAPLLAVEQLQIRDIGVGKLAASVFVFMRRC